MTKQNTDDEGRPQGFAVFLARTNKGHTLDDLDEAFAALIQAVKETGKSGKLQLTVEIKPVPKTGGAQVYITEAVTTKTPKLERPTSIFFTDSSGGVHRDMPNQHALPFGQDQESHQR